MCNYFLTSNVHVEMSFLFLECMGSGWGGESCFSLLINSSHSYAKVISQQNKFLSIWVMAHPNVITLQGILN